MKEAHFIALRVDNPTFMQAGKTLSVRKWQAAFNPEGQLDIAKTLNRIHRGVKFMVFLSLDNHTLWQLLSFIY